jgi:hypothetical protein
VEFGFDLNLDSVLRHFVANLLKAAWESSIQKQLPPILPAANSLTTHQLASEFNVSMVGKSQLVLVKYHP